jgi:phosphatidyl-myo-inositol dimannoside synthase
MTTENHSGAKPRPNVFQVGSGWFPETKGGAEKVFHSLFKELPRRGFAVRGIVPGSNDIEHETSGDMKGFRIEGISQIGRARAIRRVAVKSLAEQKPDIVACHFALYGLPILDRLARLPFVVHFHGPWSLESAAEGASAVSVAMKHGIERIIYQRADRVIVLSEAFGQLLQDRYSVKSSIIRVVPGGADLKRFESNLTRAAARTALGWDPHRRILLTVRRLVRRMGLDTLINAMLTLRQSHPDAVLYIAGSGPERPTLEAMVSAHGLTDTVRLSGYLPDDDLPLAYRAADLTVVPSLALEGFGLTAVESLASGTPVVVTPVGGLPEVVAGLSPDLILSGADAAAIANGLRTFLTDLSALPGPEHCQQYARTRFDWRHVSERVGDVYRELL